MAKPGVKAIIVIVAMLAMTVACETKKPSEEPLPEGALPPSTRMISPMTDSEGNQHPSFEEVVALYRDCKVSKVSDKKGLVYFIDCRKPPK